MRTLGELTPDIYTPTSDIETPALLVDLDIMEANIDQFMEFAAAHNVSLRPHTKTHKIPDLAHRQTRNTDSGIVCQTLGECEIMAQHGHNDIYLSHIIVEDSKLARVAWLTEKLDHFATTVDGIENTTVLQRAAERHQVPLHAYLEIDCGYNRCGIQLGEPAVEMATFIDDQPDLVLDGVMIYEAHVKHDAASHEELERRCLNVGDAVQDTVKRIESAGIEINNVIAGGTATAQYTGKHPVIDEIKPGKYAFNDLQEIEYRGWEVTRDDCAVSVLSTVRSTPAPGRAITNAGSKAISMDTDLLPVPRNQDGVAYVNHSEEHGWLDISDQTGRVEIGDRIEFIPPHVCATMNLHDTLIGIRNDRVEEVWEIHARGKLK